MVSSAKRQHSENDPICRQKANAAAHATLGMSSRVNNPLFLKVAQAHEQEWLLCNKSIIKVCMGI